MTNNPFCSAFLFWDNMVFALRITSTSSLKYATLMSNSSLYLHHLSVFLIYSYLKIASRSSFAPMLFINLCAVVAVPLTVVKHPVIFWFVVESTWELTNSDKTSNLLLLLLSKNTFVKLDTKPLVMISLFSLRQTILLIYSVHLSKSSNTQGQTFT